jgi:hypothetical protein
VLEARAVNSPTESSVGSGGPALVPPAPDGEGAFAEIPVRFEDIAQDGRMMLTALMPGLGATCWRQLTTEPFARKLLGSGTLPILTRLVLEGGDASFGVASPMRAVGRYELAHVLGASGEVERLLLSMWLEVTAPTGSTYGPRPSGGAPVATAGRVYAEHTLTRPFAEPGERRVTRIEVEGADPVPPRRLELLPPESITVLPEGAAWLDPSPMVDPAPIAFGLTHTDSNQHVNSLVYLRMFEEAVLRGAARLGRSAPWLVRRAHVAFRKPCFAGQSYRIELRLYEREGRLGATGGLLPASESSADKARPHVWLGVEG